MSLSREFVEARGRFDRNVNKAHLTDLMGLIFGSDTDLAQFDEVANRLKARQQVEKGTRMVQLDKIVGSVGRYRDFTKTFLPRSAVNRERWSKLDAVMNAAEGWPPVELFKLGEVYFVRDGNHRVSVARANGLSDIEAYVTEVQTDIPLTADDFERDLWIIKAEYADFLAETRLDVLRPEHDLRLTEPGRYQIMLHHIEVHRYLRNLEPDRVQSQHWLNWQEAVLSWYDTIYLPVVQAIHTYGLLDQFPDRTEADLYFWIVHHRERLAKNYELAPLSPDQAVATFAETHSERPLERTVQGLRQGLRRALGDDDRPSGMSEQEYQEARARHDAGEISLSESEERHENGT